MTDPTITIAGLEARINSLRSAVQHSNRTAAERMTMFVEASSNADRLTAERDALAAQLAEVRAELVQLGGADLARDAAEDRAARLDADLAKVRAELAAAPKVCAIHSYALEGPCMTCGSPWPGAEKALRQERIEGMEKMRRISAAVGCPNSVEEVVEAVAAIKSDLASERAHLAACRTRIAGLERAADERSAEVARLTARVAELEARPVLTAERLTSAAYLSRGIPIDIAAEAAKAILAVLGPVTLPAQDAAERMAAAYCDAQREIGGKEWLGWSRVASGSSEVRDLIVESMRRALASLGAPPTSPTAARPVFAGVSEDELIRLFYVVGTDGIDHGEQCPPIDSSDRNGIRAVLARLEVSLVAPVDPEQIAADITGPIGDRVRTGEWKRIKDAARTALTAAGIPVTPERGK